MMYTVGEAVQAFENLGYIRCARSSAEAGFEKIAIYGECGNYTHAARQLPSGKWLSQRGNQQDIEHGTPEELNESGHGEVVCILKRTRQGARSH